MRRSRKYCYALFGVGFFLTLVLLAALLAARHYGPQMAQRVAALLEDRLERPVRVERVLFRAWLGRVGLEGVTIAAGPTWDDGTMLSLGRAEARIGVSSLWRGEIVLARIFLRDLDLNLARADPASAGMEFPFVVPQRLAFGPWTATIKAVRLANGRIFYEDPASGRALEIAGLRAAARPRDLGTDANFTAERLSIRWADVRAQIDRLSAETRLEAGRLTLRSLDFHWQGRKIAVAGKVEKPWHEPELALTVEGEIPLEPAAERADIPWAVKGTARVSAVIDGPLQDPGVTARLLAPELSVGPVTARRVALQGGWKDGALRVTQITADIFDGHLQGSFVTAPAHPARTRLMVRVEKASLAALTGGGARGAVGLQATIQGDMRRMESLQGAMRVEIASLSLPQKASALGVGSVRVVAGLKDGVVKIDEAVGTWPATRVEAKGHFAEKTLHLAALTAATGENRVTASGNATWTGTGFPEVKDLSRQVRFRLDLARASVRLEDLARWLPQVAGARGRFDISGELGGTLRAWQGTGTLSSPAVALAQASLRDLRSEFHLSPQQIEVKNLRALLYGMPAQAEGAWSWSGDGSGSARVGPVALADMADLQEYAAIEGMGEGRFEATFRGGKAELSGAILVNDTKAYGVPLGNGTLDLALRGERIKADLSFPQAKLSGSAAGELTGARVVTARLRVEELNFGEILRRALPDRTQEVAGIASGRAILSVPLDQPAAGRGIARLYPVRLAVAGAPWESRGPIVLRWEERSVRLEQMDIHGPGGALTASGWMSAGGALELRMGGSLPLALLPSVEPRVREAAGTVEIDALVRGTLHAPSFTGEGRVKGGSFLLRDHAHSLRDVQARFTLSPQGLRLVEASGSLSGGRISASGELMLTGREVSQHRLMLGLRNFAAQPVTGLQTVWDADLEWVSAAHGGYLRGEARLVRGSYTRDLALLSLLLASETEGAGEAAFNVPLQLVVKLQDHLVVRNRTARLRIDGNVTVEGTTQSPVLFGTLKAGEGQFTIRRNRFTLVSASARFTDPRRINPFLEVVGRARIQDYDVTIHLSGPGDDLTVLLSSTPPLAQEDLLALVAFGVTRERLGAGVLAGEAAQFLVQDLLGIQAGRAGLDVLELRQDGQAGGTVRVGKKLTERTLLVYSQSLGETDERRIRVEYQLFGPLLVAGEQDFRGGFGGDLVLRLRFR